MPNCILRVGRARPSFHTVCLISEASGATRGSHLHDPVAAAVMFRK